jgi:hypothetical protein
MKYLLSICFLIYFSFEVKSQVVIAGHAIGITREVEGTVVLIDGELLHGKLTLPGSFDKKVKVNGKDIESSKIEHIDAHHPKSDVVYRFAYRELMRYKKNGELIHWKKQTHGWIALNQLGNRASQFTLSPQYRLNAGGDLILQQSFMSNFPIFGLKTGEKQAIMVSLSGNDDPLDIGTRSFFINSATRFFIDNESLVQKIKNKELGILDIFFIFEQYNQD